MVLAAGSTTTEASIAPSIVASISTAAASIVGSILASDAPSAPRTTSQGFSVTPTMILIVGAAVVGFVLLRR